MSVVKVVLTMEYQGHHVFKATLVSQLNANKVLSKDKLTRVTNPICFDNNNGYISTSSSFTSMLVKLGSDVGIFLCLETRL